MPPPPRVLHQSTRCTLPLLLPIFEDGKPHVKGNVKCYVPAPLLCRLQDGDDAEDVGGGDDDGHGGGGSSRGTVARVLLPSRQRLRAQHQHAEDAGLYTEMFHFFGQFLGIAVRNKISTPIDLPAVCPP